MPNTPTMTELEAALRAGALSAWTDRLADVGVSIEVRAAIARAIAHDRPLWTAAPASIPSVLLARVGARVPVDIRRRWCAELDASGRPWVRSLQPIRLADGLRATLWSGSTVDLKGLGVLKFPENDMVTLEAVRYHPSVQAPEARRAERVEWRFTDDHLEIVPTPEIVHPQAPRYPRFESDGWGPEFMIAAPGAARVALPCPDEGSAHAQIGRDGSLIVYGTHDEYAGGFVWFVDRQTLAVTRALETRSPVWSVDVSADGRVVLARTSDGLTRWSDDRASDLAIAGGAVALSPDGRTIAVLTPPCVQIWDTSQEPPAGDLPGGFPATFSPDGARLIQGKTLRNGTTGERIATIEVSLGSYLEGGPAWPSFHVGTQHIVCVHGGLKVWSTANGARCQVAHRRHFPQWYSLAHDRAGTSLAALRHRSREVTLVSLPDGHDRATVAFDLEDATAVALSDDANLLAIACGRSIEVRRATGELILRAAHPVDGDDKQRDPRRCTLRLVGDQLLSEDPGEGWRAWQLADGSNALVAQIPAPTIAPDWKITREGWTTFEHLPTRTRIALPIDDPWIVHPGQPTILASQEAHVELRGSSS